MGTLLVIDDDPAVRQLFEHVFGEVGWTVVSAADMNHGVAAARSQEPDVAVVDVLLPDGSGLEVLRQLREGDPKLPVLIITAGGGAGIAIEALQLGALDYLQKPLDVAELRVLVEQAAELRRLMHEPVEVDPALSALEPGTDALIGRSAAMQKVYKAIGRVAAQELTVLIRGESGTGKELVTRALYNYSKRSEATLLAINCAAIPDSLLESELFGHERGAFTGADQRRIGRFEQCQGGTLFLDEIGDMEPRLQGKLLRVLQERTFQRVGGNEDIQVDVRVIAATHRDMDSMVEAGEFREDLYYRLNAFTIDVPPLRERDGDVDLLARHFLRQAGQEQGKEMRGLSPEAVERLRDHAWPGNVRELQSVIRQAVLQAAGPVVGVDDLPALGRRSPLTGAPLHPADPLPDPLAAYVRECLEGGSHTLHDDAVAWMERRLLPLVLEHAGGVLTDAARILGMSRTTLRAKLRQHGIQVDRVTRQSGDTEE